MLKGFANNTKMRIAGCLVKSRKQYYCLSNNGRGPLYGQMCWSAMCQRAPGPGKDTLQLISDIPLLSIIIPFHRNIKDLSQALDSIARQSFRDFEILVVDDASPSALWSRVKELVRDNPRVKLLQTGEHVGAGAARNLGLSHACGMYVHFLDSDDFYRDMGSLASMVEAAQASRADILVFQHEIFDESLGVNFPPGTLEEHYFWEHNSGREPKPFLLKNNPEILLLPAYPWNKLYRKGFLDLTGHLFSPTMVHNDLAMVWKSFLEAERIVLMEKVCVVHRISPDIKHSTNDNSRRRFNLFPVLTEVEEFINGSSEYFFARPWFAKFKVDCLAFGLNSVARRYRREFIRGMPPYLEPAFREQMREVHQYTPAWKVSMIKWIVLKYCPALLPRFSFFYRKLKKAVFFRNVQ